MGCAENESGIPTQVWGDVHEDQVIEDLGWAPRLRKPLLALCGAGVVGLLLLMALAGGEGKGRGSESLDFWPIIGIALVSGCAGYLLGIPSKRSTLNLKISEENIRQANFALEEEISHREKVNEQLRHANQVLTSHVENSPLAVVHWDSDMRVKLWSSRAEKIFGLSAGKALGKTPEELGILDGRELEFFESRMNRLYRDTEPRGTFFSKHLTSEGTEVSCRWYNSALRDEEGKVYSILSLGLDETQRHQAQRRLLEYAQEIEETNTALDVALEEANCATQAKSEFLASMSHEIRTPMNGIIGMAGLLLETELTPEQRDFARTITSCGEGLLTIINDILDFSKIEAGRLDLEAIEFDLRETVEDTLDLLAKQSYENNIGLGCLIDPAIPGRLVGDFTRIRQILLNYLNNALKFTANGHVKVRVQLESETEDSVRIRTEVEDTGIGIPEDKIGLLFQSFSQVDASTTRKYGGTGLGLAICKDLAGLMDGAVGVESVEGEGSVFWFTMKLAKAQVEDSPESPTVDENRLLEGKRVLLGFADNLLSEVLGHQIQNANSDAREVSDLETVLSEISKSIEERAPYDAVVLDSRLDGLRPASILHALYDGLNSEVPPLIFVAPRGVEFEVGQKESSNGVRFLRKPIREKDFKETLGLLLNKQSETAPPREDPTEFSPRASSLHPNHRILVAEDNPVNQKIASRILEKRGYLVELVSNGEEAVQALEAMRYDLVLMDCQMPIMDGYEATQTIRLKEMESGTGNHIPILAMTANAMKGDREKCLAAGMDGYLSKPVKPEQLYAALNDYLAANSVKATA
ncbi:MAG: response regulator [Candidatus Omnitrophica bacterium]|nr:response regulator [Candidatus Omnitrophota bacterium]